MPALPRLLADLVEPRFARACRVTGVEELAPRLRRVRFSGLELCKLPFRPGQEIEVRVDATAFRHYTPADYDAGRGSMEVVFYLHGGGPGSRWANDLRVGRAARLLGPGGRFGLADSRTHVFLGDETCLGLFAILARSAPATHRITGAIEVDAGCEHWPKLVDAPLEAVTRATRGAALHGWLERARLAPEGDATIYLAGHARSIAALRDTLRWWGWPRGAIRTKAYWADDKRGL
jgi:NADPH-dependent ferric siderophore reductase